MQPHKPEQRFDTDVDSLKPSLLDTIVEERERIGARYMPTLTVKQFVEREGQLKELKELLVKDVDYGTIPGTPKPTLYQAGAQKICTFFGYAPSYSVEEIEDWDGSRHGGEPLFYYKYTCTLMKDGKPVGQGTGSCNSWESKYRYRWSSDAPANLEGVMTKDGVISEPKFAVDKAETSGPYGKPAEYWQRFKDAIERDEAKTGIRKKKGGGEMATWEIGGKLYRIPNEGFPDIINTVQKIAQKRAYVGACLSATGASQYFTQDIEDMPHDAIGKSDAPAPGSGSQKPGFDYSKSEQFRTAELPKTDAEWEKEDPALTDFLNRAGLGKEAAQEVFAEIVDAIKRDSDDATGKQAWIDATAKISGKAPSPTEVTRHLYKTWLGVAEPKEPVA